MQKALAEYPGPSPAFPGPGARAAHWQAEQRADALAPRENHEGHPRLFQKMLNGL